MNLVKINAEYLRTANYALFHNRIQICQAVTVTNISDRPIENIQVTCSGEFISRYESELIALINPGETIKISPYKITPDAAKLATLTERVITEFTLKATVKNENYNDLIKEMSTNDGPTDTDDSENIGLRDGDGEEDIKDAPGKTTIGELVCELELMPFDYWTGITILPQTIASFITPNHPAINNIVVRSAAILKQLTGSSAFNEYQTGDNNDVRQQVAAIFAALHEIGIIYRSLPATFEEIGQRITMPDQVLATKIGNCIELTLLMASVLEAVGLNSLIIINQGHTFLGVWLVDDCYSCSLCDDPAFIEKKCSRGIDEMLVVECTQLTKEKTSFEEAVRIAEMNMIDHSKFGMFIDVKRCRLERIFPLPSRIDNNGQPILETEGVEHDACMIDVKEHDRYDLSRIPVTSHELTKFDIWERKLLDFTLRNSLLNLSLRRRAIQFISFEVNMIEDILQKGKEFRITSLPSVEILFDSSEKMIRSKMYAPLQDLVINDIKHELLHTYLEDGDTKDILKNISRAAKNAIEETGANTLFLAIGILRWFETGKSSKPRYAPLLLLPVEMVYKKGSYYIRTRDEEIFLNITLMEFLRQNYNITISGLNPLPLDESGVDVSLIFAIIRDALKEQKRWDVEEEAILGLFSFSKFMMWNDIHNHRDQLLQNDIISSLLANQLTWKQEPAAADLKYIDNNISPIDIALPVAVDSSQMAAVIEGANGNSFILYGPPGTGKSQTITNLIANALYHGKRVLFVAEKMAALNVVQSRLAKIGLDPFCLELHSNKSSKRHVLGQLEKALKVVHIVPPADYASQADKIFSKRKELIRYIDALHTPDPVDGLSLYDWIVRYESIDEEPLPEFIYDKTLEKFLAEEGIKGIEGLLGRRLSTLLKIIGNPADNPLKGFHINRYMLSNVQQTVVSMKEDAALLCKIHEEGAALRETKKIFEKLMQDNSDAILEEDPEALRMQWREANSKWFLPRFIARRDFIKRLRQFNKFLVAEEVDNLIQNLIIYHKNHEQIKTCHRILLQYFDIRLGLDELPDSKSLEEAVVTLSRWANHASKMRDWFHWTEYCDELREKGLGGVADSLNNGLAESSSIKDAYLKALYRYKIEQIIARSEFLTTFEGMLFDETIAAYRQLTDEFQTLTQKELYARLGSRVPRMTDNAATGSEIGFLNRNISNGGRGMSLRDIFDQLPTLLPRLCPCMLMSPMSAAQFIDLSTEKFDLVIFDEASQMPTSEAIGAIARGKSLIVVGDPKQMPPTSFFSSTNVDAEEAIIDDMESILEDCRTLDMPSLQLTWHYRSRHESLIAFSNNEYYDGSLITFPSVDDRKTKVHHVPVEGFYDKGGTRTNQAEAEAIVDEIVRRLKDRNLRRQSIGVISFSVVQQSLIEDLLQERLDNDKPLLEAAIKMYEPIFIKNLENVQGDERDVILFSIGYGPDKDGRVSMNFGPLNNPGGERRLNVAVSRARQEMYIFSTLKSSDIDLRRSKARGVEGLKHFLIYAETQMLPSVAKAHAVHRNSPIAEQIADELRNRGFNATTNVGRSQFRVDIAISKPTHPNRYCLGILLDGETYRDTHTTRDREVVQPSVLRGLNWKVMRVWSIDWFNNQERVIDRILEKLSETSVDNSNATTSSFQITFADIEERKSNAREYELYNTNLFKALEAPDAQLIREIVATEQPIGFMLLCRRLNNLRLHTRVTTTVMDSVRLFEKYYYVDKGGNWWLSEEDSREYKFYRPNANKERDISELTDVEIINAMKETLEEQLALDEESLSLTAARKMGYTRCGVNVKSVFRNIVEKMKTEGIIEPIGDRFRLSACSN